VRWAIQATIDRRCDSWIEGRRVAPIPLGVVVSAIVSFSRRAAADLWDIRARGSARGRVAAADPDRHLRAAEAWLVRAHDATPDDGVSYGYSLRGGWRPSYRETSGYIATTFFNLAEFRHRPEYRERAIRIARWLCSVQNRDGSFSNPHYGPDGIVFDTGQALFGLVRAHRETGEPVFLEAASAAGRWLVQIADGSRVWTRNEHLGTPHVYNTRTAWALLQLARVASAPGQEEVARANLDWAVSEQRDGYFSNAAFRRGVAPYTHTIAYTIRGLLESGRLLGDARYLASAEAGARAMLRHVGEDGFVPGQVDEAGRAAAAYCCLTGNCQLAIIWAKLFDDAKDEGLRRAATRALDYVMACQDVTTDDLDVRGAIKGSQPIWGRYAPMSYPNWATKFFIDAMILRSKWTA
jgi:hypothetical protein